MVTMIPYHRGVPSTWFRISFAEKAFLRFLGERRPGLDGHTVAEGVAAMRAFYLERRAQHTKLDEDGDGLLVEWGTSNGEPFLQVVRQLQRSDDDAPLRQLALRFTVDLPALPDGRVWLFDPARADEFDATLAASAPYASALRADTVHTQLLLDTL